MLRIIRKNGSTRSEAQCDVCGKGIYWEGITPLSRMEAILRRHKGWGVGKHHVCGECLSKARDETNGKI
jgi:hypothetical protein